MVTAQRYVHPLQQWLDQNGDPLTGGKLYFYETNSSTPLATYSDSGLTTPNANPVEAGSTPGAFSNGVWPDIFLQNQAYKVILKDRNGVEVWTADPVYPFIDTDPTLSSFYAPPIYMQGKPSAGEVYPIWNIPFAMTLPVSLTSSIFTIQTLPTSTFTITLYKNASSIGTIAFNTSGVPTVTFLSQVTFNIGDQMSVTWPGSQDATGANIALSFVFTVV